MPDKKSFFSFLFAVLLLGLFSISQNSCKIYKFADVSIPDSIKTVKVNFIENKARYVNPQLSPQFTDKLRQKIVSQTRLTQVNNENAHWEITGYVSDYSVTTSAITQQREASNRLTVGVHIKLNKRLENKVDEFDISRSFDFSASLSLAQAESRLQEEIIRNLVDEVFNRLFSNW